MSLTEYRKKRDFKKTAEPAEGRGKAKAGELRYVIQKHAASRLHYDFRLELDGTLKSWAVPKGPSLDPHDKQLAVHVEDHPVAYGDFEGIIPEGEYGGGTVMVWDQGTWEPKGEGQKDYRAGKLKFTLHGEKLKGDWALIEMHGDVGDGGKNWLLIKEHDDEERPGEKYDVRKAAPLSVLSGRDLDEIAADADRVWSSHGKQDKRSSTKSVKKSSEKPAKNGRAQQPARSAHRKKAKNDDDHSTSLAKIPQAKRTSMPQELAPQLATLVSSAPSGDQWLHELKFDGYRLLAFVENDDVRLMTRNGNDWTEKFTKVAAAVKELHLSGGILDGEVVLLRDDGVPDFQRLQNAMKDSERAEFIYYVFDLPYCDGYDLRDAELIDRKNLLQRVIERAFPNNTGTIRYSDHILGQGGEVAEQSCLHEMEGIVSKRRDSAYESGRSRSWVKTKCQKRQEFVIGGYTKPGGSREGFGSLLLGYYEEGELRYSGRVGTGFTSDSLEQVFRRMKPLRTDECPFVEISRAEQKGLAAWVRPELVAEVEFTEWTDENSLRHPSFKGLREDKPARKIVQEKPAQLKTAGSAAKKAGTKMIKSTSSATHPDHDEAEVGGVRISHAERVIYPSINLTKLALADYYAGIAEWVLPHMVDRPLVLVRCPGGQTGECFYQKHLEGTLPPGVSTIPIKEKRKTDDYAVIHELTGLISLVQFGALEIHPWGARSDQPERPDRMVFDLDPGEDVAWEQVVEGVKEVRDRLKDLGLESFLRTSGGKGLHVVVPITRRRTWDEVKDFAHQLATRMTQDSPRLYIDNMSKAKRKGRVFIDYLRNGRGATAIASYSTRAREGAPVATPLRWDELGSDLRPNQYNVLNLPRRLQALKSDPWEGFFEVRQSLSAKALKQVAGKSPKRR